jgi:hypothetical protein
MKQYIGISRDHSGSMGNIAHLAMKDYNEQIATIKESAIRFGIDTILSVVSCSIKEPSNGYIGRTENKFDVQLSSISSVKRMFDYPATGSNTQLFDSVNMLIDQFVKVPDYNSPDVAFALHILTDGVDNNSRTSGYALGTRIKELQATDKWTIAFRVPQGMKQSLVRLGIPAGNILEVNYSSEEDIEKATVVQKAATTAYYTSRSAGVRGSSAFYADTSNLTPTVVKQELSNISKRIKVIRVPQQYDGYKIQDFVEEKHGGYILGTTYYQLTKREEVQDNKRIVVWNKLNGEYYSGHEARTLLGLPTTGNIKLVPGQMPDFEVFVQSNSVNRKLVGGTKVIIWNP